MASSKAFILFLTLLLCVYGYLDEYQCNHDLVEHDPQIADIEEDLSAFEEGRVLESVPSLRLYP
jgi:hypothetical protein